MKYLSTPLVLRAILLLFGIALITKAIQFSAIFATGEENSLIDFDAFHIVGQMVWRGISDEAYHYITMMQAQRSIGGGEGFLPWAYPPQFNLVVAPLALLPLWLAYLVFTGATLAVYLFVLRWIARENFAAVLVAIFPAIIVMIACGQNGFLTGTLIGLACIGLLQQRWSAGIPLGLMIIKPHLTAAFVLYTVATGRWTTVAVAATTVALSTAFATLVFGPQIWTAFLHGTSEARAFLEAGLYPLFRMISSYAVMRTLGFSAPVAMTAHGIIALLALLAVWTAIRRGMHPKHVLGIAALATLLVSPYGYDYDLPIYGIALGLLMPDLLRVMTGREQAALVGLSWFTGIWGLAQSRALVVRFGADGIPSDLIPLSLGGGALVLLFALIWRALERSRASAPGNTWTWWGSKPQAKAGRIAHEGASK